MPIRRLLATSLLFAVMASAHAAPPPPSEQQVTAFFRAVQLDDADTVRTMVGAVVNANELNPLGGEPPLVLAIREGSREVVRELLRHPGTDLERQALNGNTALMMAAFKRDEDVVRALLAKGAKVNQPGWTALHYAAASGDEKIAQLLIERGAQIDALSPRASGAFTPLMLAAREGQESTARLLLARGAKVGLKNTEGHTAAQIAKQAGREKLADELRIGR
ncbi:ankyrin repeat domain-containing protein [Telluria beijingensis]|uniref:ankyrin repeat domain-containing protein n=1 Tax=Telluria beijingensis TaxID=3068633 RepID=UPI002795AD92|nr:ankyrin repeat domain-containing protein [Massilia sp. REN29]